jgi:O-antigen ligase
MTRPRLTELLFLAGVFTITFEQLHWNVAGNVTIADIFAILFLISAAAQVQRHNLRLPKATGPLLCFLAAFLLVYLVSYYNLETSQALTQFFKGMIKFLIHYLFLVAGVALLIRRGVDFYWRTLRWFVAGMAVNAAYGVLQLLVAKSGHNLDHLVLSPLTGGASSINLYGIVGGTQNVYRPQALTGDPNHLAIMLDVPLLVLTPIYLRLERGSRLRLPLAAILAFLFVVELSTLSRSGILGLAVGGAILLIVYRRRFASRTFLLPLVGVGLVLAVIVYRRLHFFTVVLASRVQTGGKSTSAHFAVYSFIPQILHLHPLFGLGLNTFSVYYESVTGKMNWGPHSFFVALVVETGLIGTAVFVTFLWYAFRRCRDARAVGRRLAKAGDPHAARVRPLAWGLTAALAGTIAANAFYLTMTFAYFYFLLMLIFAAPVVFSKRLKAQPVATTVP